MIQNAANISSAQGHEQPEVIVAPTPEESAAMQAAMSAPVEMPPAEEAAMKFTTLLPYVLKLGQAMPSQKGVVRVLYALAEFPLGASKPRLLTEGERQLFHVMSELQGLKSTVIQDIMKKNALVEQMKQTAVAESATAETGASSGSN